MNKIKEQFIEKSSSEEMLDIVECLDRAEQSNLLIEVVYTALKEMKSNPKSSPLLCLQIALDSWDC
jgi:hypothetical protein